jgi:FMN-dependent NADH-azoreductase
MEPKHILAVTYLPRGDRSHTKELLKAALSQADEETVTHLDLLSTVPDLFDAQRVGAYIHRDYLGEELSDADADSLRKMDGMVEQLHAADIVVLATPMYNFSLPATVKAWFDSVMLKGKTWDADESGYTGLLTGRKALILMAAGGEYDGPMASWDHAMSLAKQEFQFMGFDEVESVWLQGVNLAPDSVPARKQKAAMDAESIMNGWL